MKVEPGLYKHRNGNIYEVLTLARNSNDCQQELVVYRSMEDSDFPKGTVWVRPVNDFICQGRFVLLQRNEISY